MRVFWQAVVAGLCGGIGWLIGSWLWRRLGLLPPGR
jgi:hypothetical protein